MEPFKVFAVGRIDVISRLRVSVVRSLKGKWKFRRMGMGLFKRAMRIEGLGNLNG